MTLARRRRSAADVREKFAREYHSDDRRRWVAELPCLVCSMTPCENAHTRNDGMGRKGPYITIVPLCACHHRESHAIGVKSFEQKYTQPLCGRTLESWAETVESAWQLVEGNL
jgi:hypothetical protein